MPYDPSSVHAARVALLLELAATRERFDALAVDLRRDQGESSPLVGRAEEVSAAVQRLEWQFARSQAEAARA